MKSGVLNAIEVYKDNHNQVLWMRAEREKWIYNCLFAVIVILFAVIVVFLYRKYNTLVIQKNSELMEVRESMNDILNQLNEKKYEIFRKIS
jgi:cell division protein FtsL